MVAVERSWIPAAGAARRTEAGVRPAVGKVAAAAMGAKKSARTPSETRMSTRGVIEAFEDFLSLFVAQDSHSVDYDPFIKSQLAAST